MTLQTLKVQTKSQKFKNSHIYRTWSSLISLITFTIIKISRVQNVFDKFSQINQDTNTETLLTQRPVSVTPDRLSVYSWWLSSKRIGHQEDQTARSAAESNLFNTQPEGVSRGRGLRSISHAGRGTGECATAVNAGMFGQSKKCCYIFSCICSKLTVCSPESIFIHRECVQQRISIASIQHSL